MNALLALCTALGTAGVLHSLKAPRAPFSVAWPLLAALFALGHLANVRFDQKGTNYSFDLANAVLIPACSFVAPQYVVVSALIGVAFHSLYLRRAAINTAFNTALHGTGALFGVLCYHTLIRSATPLSLQGAWAATAAVAVAELTTHLGVMGVVSVVSGRMTSFRSRQPWLVLAYSIVADAVLGIGWVHVLSANKVVGILFLLVAVALGAQFGVHGRLRQRHARLQQLYEFERSLAGMVESDQVIAAVLSEALRLLNAEVAQIVLGDGLNQQASVTYTMRRDAAAVTSERGLHPLVALMGSAREPLVVPKGTANVELADALDQAGFRDAVALRVELDDEAAPAFLVVANSSSGQTVTFGERDVALLESLVAPAAMALRSSSLLSKLREEIASKEHEATHDPLTGLANRILVGREIDQALARRSTNAVVGVMVVDIDDFKGVNDGFGHDSGDAFLCAVAQRLHSAVAGRGHVGRLGGDEFAVVVPYARHSAEIATVAADLDIAVRAPVQVGTAAIVRRASIGVAIAPRHGNDRSALLRAADLSMYLAKQRGGGVVVYSQDRGSELDRPSLLAALREAIATSSLDLNYQPKVALQSGRVVGVEALLRWTHPVFGPISPERFIPEAESSGLIRPLTRWVLATAIAQCSIWHTEGLDLHVAVNLSPTQMDDEDVVIQVRQLLEAHRLPPSSLVLEITESGALEDFPGDHAHVLEPLAALGVGLSIDDFGVGTSSLARIKNLPVTEIKIDKSFITDLGPDSVDGAIVASTINLAHQLGLTVVAEGVESADTFRQLAELGCDIAQGYLMSVPLRPDDLGAWFRDATEGASGGRHWETPSYGRLASS
jgi:diguanylate cyclase (GGDEF)-like protein